MGPRFVPNIKFVVSGQNAILNWKILVCFQGWCKGGNICQFEFIREIGGYISNLPKGADGIIKTVNEEVSWKKTEIIPAKVFFWKIIINSSCRGVTLMLTMVPFFEFIFLPIASVPWVGHEDQAQQATPGDFTKGFLMKWVINLDEQYSFALV